MGNKQAAQKYEREREVAAPDTTATLYYFAGRGKADQIRWLLAATNITFTHRVLNDRSKFIKMAERQLPFGQVPLLQIDGLEIVQSQAIVRYIAKRENLDGKTSADEAKCDMIAETVNDIIGMMMKIPFLKFKENSDEYNNHIIQCREKWIFVGGRFEAILVNNGSKYLVGSSLTYADILVVHVLTWFVEECGPEIVYRMPALVDLQYRVITLPSIQNFIRSGLYYPVGDETYTQEVSRVLGRVI